MKKKSLKMIVAALAIAVVGGMLAGCGNNTANNRADNSGDGTKVEEVSGSITVVGSTALQPLAKAGADMFMQKNSKVQINVQGGGSGTGLSQVASGAVQIGNSDVTAESKIKDANLVKQLVDHKVAAIGFAMVVNKETKVDSLTKQQVQDIFTGKITNWKQVGGDDVKIKVINRGKSSGTRAAFVGTIMGGKTEAEGLGTTLDSSGAVQQAIQATNGSISYLALSYFISDEAKQGIKLLKIEGVDPTYENIAAGKYPFWSYEHMYTKGEPTGATKAYLDYMTSDEVKSVIKSKGYLPADEIKAQK
ncbi:MULTISPECIES: phosphate ABC transporter substrate-binding protein [Clostridium]|jgi:phosphate transport system substrate-binding protein|uniref:phosphate ABC transporter substrate-binding protein n=1 Tax=Clostridium TaxID=1485 RepID=UPI0023562C25|nr:phosphate ABC transporter substrate-binding protein [Clostridium thermopalmarium]MBE6044161.1 phosphate ABC transporter substrate-binding protein [Clostridium thermopalmarium]